MPDRGLAELYGVDTALLKRAVKKRGRVLIID
jgi:hypothetical protein